jgi:hypothetical protein
MHMPDLPTFLIDYPYEGGTRTLYIKAIDWNDAEAQLSAIRARGTVEGELVETGEVTSIVTN